MYIEIELHLITLCVIIFIFTINVIIYRRVLILIYTYNYMITLFNNFVTVFIHVLCVKATEKIFFSYYTDGRYQSQNNTVENSYNIQLFSCIKLDWWETAPVWNLRKDQVRWSDPRNRHRALHTKFPTKVWVRAPLECVIDLLLFFWHVDPRSILGIANSQYTKQIWDHCAEPTLASQHTRTITRPATTFLKRKSDRRCQSMLL